MRTPWPAPVDEKAPAVRSFDRPARHVEVERPGLTGDVDDQVARPIGRRWSPTVERPADPELGRRIAGTGSEVHTPGQQPGGRGADNVDIHLLGHERSRQRLVADLDRARGDHDAQLTLGRAVDEGAEGLGEIDRAVGPALDVERGAIERQRAVLRPVEEDLP